MSNEIGSAPPTIDGMARRPTPSSVRSSGSYDSTSQYFSRCDRETARAQSRDCLKPAQTSVAHRRLTNVNALSGKPNEDAVFMPSGWRGRLREIPHEY
jgi:hypothetical protein